MLDIDCTLTSFLIPVFSFTFYQCRRQDLFSEKRVRWQATWAVLAFLSPSDKTRCSAIKTNKFHFLIFCEITFMPAVTFCYQVHPPKTDTHIPTAALLCYFRCNWCRNLSAVNCIDKSSPYPRCRWALHSQ